MKNLFLAIALFVNFSLAAQSAADAAVQITATVQSGPPQITLSWAGNASTTQYQLYRKLKGGLSWGSVLASLSGTTTQYTDNAVSAGVSYEYRVTRTGAGYTGYGYINSGIEVPETHYRGKLVLMIDSTFVNTLNSELSRLIADIESDGWQVLPHFIARNASVPHIKSIIKSDYTNDVTNTKAVFLVGHVPVPYSGNINPDGHGDHLGAWPADCYYADMDGIWSDNIVSSTTASPPRTQNVPGDGKFDQSVVPSNLELQVGRVDFNDMPAFSQTEQQLLKNYLDKDHDYRKKIYSPVKRAVIDDNFGYFGGEAFAASGFKNFAPLVGNTNISQADYFTTLTSGSYAWSYGCGGGTYVSAGGVGATSNFAASNLQGVFTMLFGSYFGDWDSQNNFLRAALAQGKTLTNVWSGRPHYQFHHMALGENIGFSVLLTQNNLASQYYAGPTGITGKWIHNALMGDPTLRNDVVAPPQNIIASVINYDGVISWSASTETSIVGYNLYMKNDTNTSFVKLNNQPLTTTSFTDPCLQHKGHYTYMVKTLKLEVTPSGTYYNMSEGISDTAQVLTGPDVIAAFNTSVNGNVINLVNTSTNSTLYSWNSGAFSSTTPVAAYTVNSNGAYSISLVASNKCASDTVRQTVNICHWLATAAFTSTVSGDSVYLTSNSLNADSIYWDFGDGQTGSGNSAALRMFVPATYTVMLVVKNSCSSDTAYSVINVIDAGVAQSVAHQLPSVYPNPAGVFIKIAGVAASDYKLSVMNADGRKVLEKSLSAGEEINIEHLARGVYFVRIQNGGSKVTRKLVLQ
jgi:hypothetical protein